MAEIKSLGAIAKKWKQNASGAGPAYKDGVSAPRRSWSAAASGADDLRKAGLVAADARDAFRTGVEKAGDTKWKNNAVKLGTSRYSQGVGAAEQEMSNGFAPYHAVIASLTLSPRGPKGSPENLNRVGEVANALHSAKQGA